MKKVMKNLIEVDVIYLYMLLLFLMTVDINLKFINNYMRNYNYLKCL